VKSQIVQFPSTSQTKQFFVLSSSHLLSSSLKPYSHFSHASAALSKLFNIASVFNVNVSFFELHFSYLGTHYLVIGFKKYF